MRPGWRKMHRYQWRYGKDYAVCHWAEMYPAHHQVHPVEDDVVRGVVSIQDGFATLEDAMKFVEALVKLRS
jgi:hypothetical protein